MSAFFRVDVECEATNSGLFSDLNPATDSLDTLTRTGRYIADSVHPKGVRVCAGANKATGTVTFSSFAFGDTVTINGQALTGVTTPSGVTEFAIGSNTVTATNLADLVDESALAALSGIVSAESEAAVVTLTADVPGLIGNAITLAISAHGSVSGSRLSGGTDGLKADINAGL